MYTVNDESLLNIATAIKEKTGKNDALLFPDDFVTAISEISTGGALLEEKDVNFYDYDGTLLKSYTQEEALQLTALPEPPEHENLVFDGWNYTLEDIKANANACEIGALYVTADNKTHLHLSIEEIWSTMKICLAVTGAGTVYIDWGDGLTSNQTSSFASGGNFDFFHDYAQPGEYDVKIHATGGAKFAIGGGSETSLVEETIYNASLNKRTLRAIELSDTCRGVTYYGLNNHYNLETITMHSGINLLDQYSFYQCKALKYLVIPKGITEILNSTFLDCHALKSISLPTSVFSFPTTFTACSGIERLIIPEDTNTSYTSKNFYYNMMSFCYSLKKFVNNKSRYTAISNGMFESCLNLKEVYFANLKTINSNAMKLTNTAKIEGAGNLETVGEYAFENSNIEEITLGTNCSTVTQSSFSDCLSLTKVVFLGNVTSIKEYAFYNCNSLMEVDLTNCTAVPALSSAYSFPINNDKLKIKVKASLVDAFKTATNWSMHKDRIVGV